MTGDNRAVYIGKGSRAEVDRQIAAIPTSEKVAVIATTVAAVLEAFQAELGPETANAVAEDGFARIQDRELGEYCTQQFLRAAKPNSSEKEEGIIDKAEAGRLPIATQTILTSLVIVPLLKTFQSKLGGHRANEIARPALRRWAMAHGEAISRLFPGSDVEKMATAFPLFTDGACDYEVLKQTGDEYHLNVTGCLYAEYFKAIGEPELGAMIWCGADFPMAQGIGEGVILHRTQTIMEGASFCDFRYRDPRKKDLS